MNIAIFGASGMVGQGAMRVCLNDPEVQRVISVARTPTGIRHDKLREVLHLDFLDFAPIENELTDLDSCLYCLGASSSGMNEESYARVIYGFTIAAANTLLRGNASLSFVFVSGAGSDRTERGHVMWARVKGKTENALLAMPFRSAYMFRPGIIQPLDGIESKTPSYRILYRYAAPLLTLIRQVFPRYVTTTNELGRAMLGAAKHGTEKRVVEAKDIRALLGQLP